MQVCNDGKYLLRYFASLRWKHDGLKLARSPAFLTIGGNVYKIHLSKNIAKKFKYQEGGGDTRETNLSDKAWRMPDGSFEIPEELRPFEKKKKKISLQDYKDRQSV